ncbi:MAG TPA: hypothetical protein DDX91_03595 [Ruminococcaceae bacterium]|nr:hypothetical protein [Oscillospiraceae bacterium]
MYGLAKERLETFGYGLKKSDEALLKSSVRRAEEAVRNFCCIDEIPDELASITADMAAGEFLAAKKAFCPRDIEGIDLDAAVKRIEVGDTNTIFAVGEGSLTSEQRFDIFVERLLSGGKNQLLCFRRVRW